MRRIAAILAALAVIAALLAVGATANSEEDGTYEVRGIFANGGFLVSDEEVRIAGAKVGEIAEVDVTGRDEAAHADGAPEPGSAVVVMRIDDPAFQDFREDAFCLIRPQGLLGERFVECEATQPRAPGSSSPPELDVIPDGEPGAGQRLLPLEQTGKQVDLDLINSIMERPYPERFRLILNDLGAAFAARGEEVEQLIEGANPALRKTDQVLAILAKQNRDLAQLARDSDQALAPVARDRDRVSGFINNANVAAEATAERRADLEAGIQKLPPFLTELRATMTELDRFAESSTPVVSDLGDAAPALTRMTEALGPFSRGGRISLESLGDAAEEAGPSLVAADPILVRIRQVARNAGPLGKVTADLLSSLRRNKGYANLMGFLFNAAGATNGFDSFGRFARLLIPINNCVDYRPFPESSCESIFVGGAKQRAAAKGSSEDIVRDLLRSAGKREDEPGESGLPELDPDALEDVPAEPQAREEPVQPDSDTEADEDAAANASSARGTRLLLAYLLGEGQPSKGDRGGRR